MIIISHRGNLNGPNPDRENDPAYILEAIGAGFEVEADIWEICGIFMLGHDKPSRISSVSIDENMRKKILFHAKNIYAAVAISQTTNWHFFCHQGDPFVLTSKGYIWQHDLSLPLTYRSIIPLITMEAIKAHRNFNVHAVCTDYPVKLREMLSNK